MKPERWYFLVRYRSTGFWN